MNAPMVLSLARVTHPKGPRDGFEIEIKGKLAALIGGSTFPRRDIAGDAW